VHWLKFAAGQDVACLTFLHFAEKHLKQLSTFSLYSCKTMKCHRHALTLSKKYEIVSFWESNKHLSQRDISLCFGIPTSTLGDMLKMQQKLKESFGNSSYSTDAKRQRKTRFDDVEVALLAWFKKTRMNNPEVAISGRVLLEKANNFGKQLAHSEDSISAAWIDRWKTRHNIVSKKMCSESADVHESELLVHEWKAIKLRQILDTLSPRDIFNADEAGPFWKVSPYRTLAFKYERVSSGKLSKGRVKCLVLLVWLEKSAIACDRKVRKFVGFQTCK
jgi:hypothetical protein